MSAFPKLRFHEWVEESDLSYAESKGYFAGADVEMENGDTFPVFFYEPIRLSQDLQFQVDNTKEDWSMPCIAETGMIVIAEVTVEKMEAAIQYLSAKGWFEQFKPKNERRDS